MNDYEVQLNEAEERIMQLQSENQQLKEELEKCIEQYVCGVCDAGETFQCSNCQTKILLENCRKGRSGQIDLTIAQSAQLQKYKEALERLGRLIKEKDMWLEKGFKQATAQAAEIRRLKELNRGFQECIELIRSNETRIRIVKTLEWMIKTFDWQNKQGMDHSDSPELKDAKELLARLRGG